MAMNKLPIKIEDGVTLPQYFTSDDGTWLKQLLFLFKRFEGKTPDSLHDFIGAGLPFKTPFYKGRFALEVLQKELQNKIEASADLTQVRMDLFVLATKCRRNPNGANVTSHRHFRETITKNVLESYPHLVLEQIEVSLLNGGGSHSTLKPIESLGEFSELPRKLNGLLIRKLMMRSYVIEFVVSDQCRRLVRQAKLRGLVCEISKLADQRIRFRISGPRAIFESTTLYGRSLQEFIPLLFWQRSFTLRASLRIQKQTFFLYIDATSPLKVSSPPQLFDSKIEEKFYHEFGQAMTLWELLREPEPLNINGRMLFMDFLAYHRHEPAKAVFIELIGFWTEAYLRKKVGDIHLLRDYRVLFIVSDRLRPTLDKLGLVAFPKHRMVFYKRKLPISQIIENIDELAQL